MAIQQELAAQDVPARIGIHVGEVIVEPERLTGDAVNIAARIESFAVPGGVMLSDDAYAQLRNRGDVSVVSLGEFRLKNVGRPFELYAVAAEGLVVPDPATLEGKGERLASLPSNLPVSATPLVGRAADLALALGSRPDHRVVTISGPGGVGKTRVLAELGRLLAPEFLDGVAFVAACRRDPGRDFRPRARRGARREGGGGPHAGRGDRRAARRPDGALLLLDNLEQIVDRGRARGGRAGRGAVPSFGCVATSRTPLRIAAERSTRSAPLETDSAVSLFVAALPGARARSS